MEPADAARGRMSRALLHAVAATALLVAGVGARAAPMSVSEAFSLPQAQVEASIAESHPSIAVALAKRLFDAGRRDEAVVWFYIGQLRYRFHLMANPASRPAATPPSWRR
jgi:hypothetical protein